jgi:formylglycine-generating enzyme required for sulfatase activity
MHPQHDHIALPLEQFFVQLHAAGFRMDTGRKLRLLRALQHHAAAQVGHLSDLKYLLAPFVATSPEEQRRFHEFFDAFLLDCRLEADQWAKGAAPPPDVPQEPPPPPPNPPKPPGFWRKYRLPLTGLALLLVVLFYLIYKPPPPLPPARIDYTHIHPEYIHPKDGILREGAKTNFQNTVTDLHPDSSRWELRDAETDSLERADTALSIRWTAQGYGRTKKILLDAGTRGRDSLLLDIHCATPPAMPAWTAPEPPLVQGRSYTFAVTPKESNAQVQWTFQSVGRDTVVPGNTARMRVVEAGTLTVTCKIYFNDHNCYVSENRPFSVGFDKPILPLAGLQYDSPRTDSRLKLWVWLLFLLPLLPAAWLLWHWWKKRRETPAAESDAEMADRYPLHDKGPYFIPYLPPDGKISTPPDFFRMAEVLRRREESERREVDVPASVRATVDRGGFPTLLDRRDTTPPNYLFLIERPDSRDQQGRLFERLATFLENQDAPLVAYYHDGNYHSFWNDAKPDGVSFSYLHRQYPGHRLVLIGTGHALANPYDTRLPALRRAPLEALLYWKKALFLSTMPVSAWAAPEVLLHRHFLLFPADTAGIRAGLEALEVLEEYEPGPYLKWEAALAKNRPDPDPRSRLWETAEQHREFLSAAPAADFKWLCGLAVAVQPDFALTVAIGKKMGVEVTHDGLLRLSRIPWLSRNEPDTRLRLELLDCLSADEERLARQAVAEELDAEDVQKDIAGGFAELDWKANRAIHRFALDPNDPDQRRTLLELMQLGLLSEGQLRELDGIVERRLNRRRKSGPAGSGFADPAGALFAEYMHRKPLFTPALTGALLLVALSLGLCAAGWWQQRHWQQNPEQAPAQQQEVVDSALIWHNEAVRMALKIRAEEDYAVWAGPLQDTARLADSLFERAIRDWSGEYLLDEETEPYIHRQNFRFNMAAQRFNFFLTDSVGGEALNAAAEEFTRLATTVREQVVNNGVPQESPRQIAQDTFKVYSFSEITTANINALHGLGLCKYFQYRATKDTFLLPGAGPQNRAGEVLLAAAVSAYNDLLLGSDSLYFDTLSMPVNLETLLFPEKETGKEQCRLVPRRRQPLVLRNRALSQPEFDELLKNPTGRLNQETYLDIVPGETEVVYLDSVRLSYKIRYKGITGYVPIFVGNKPTLLPCGAGTADTAQDTRRMIRSNTTARRSGLEMVPLQGGTFIMGCRDEKRDGDCSDDEKPPHGVTLHDFSIGKYEVTQADWRQVMGSDPPELYNTGCDQCPVEGVSWNDAQEFIKKLNAQTGKTYRLPSEAEWEYAARGGTKSREFLYSGSNKLDEVGWYEENYKSGNTNGSQKATRPVGALAANELGLYDMSGNVWEWVEDDRHSNYNGAPTDGRVWLDSPRGTNRVLRGGYWHSTALGCRAACRGGNAPARRNGSIGFRLAHQ